MARRRGRSVATGAGGMARRGEEEEKEGEGVGAMARGPEGIAAKEKKTKGERRKKGKEKKGKAKRSGLDQWVFGPYLFRGILKILSFNSIFCLWG